MELVLQILANTPKWVFVVLVVLFIYGRFLSKPRKMNNVRLAILPVVMTTLSIGGVLSSFGASLHTLGPWAAGFVLAVVLNRFIGSPGGVRYDAATKLFHIPGTWVPLALMMGIFACKYVDGATRAMRPDVAASPEFAMALSGVFGLFCGTFFARFLKTRSAASDAGAAAPQAPGAAETARGAS